MGHIIKKGIAFIKDAIRSASDKENRGLFLAGTGGGWIVSAHFFLSASSLWDLVNWASILKTCGSVLLAGVSGIFVMICKNFYELKWKDKIFKKKPPK